MAEVKTLIGRRPLSYTGLFDIHEIHKRIEAWAKEHHYDKVERKNFEEDFGDHKQVIIELAPDKKISDYAKVIIGIWMEFTNLKEEVVEIEGVKQKMFRGSAGISFDCILETDYENHWETKPLTFFMRTLVEKFIHKTPMQQFEDTAIKECNEIINEIKSYFNMLKLKKGH